MILRIVIVMVSTSLFLLGCNDQTQGDNAIEYSGALSLSKLESRDQLGAMPRAENGSSGTLLPVDDTTVGDLRFRVQASNQDQGIDQLYITFDQMESADFFEGVAFSLCDSNCDFNSVDAWVSGLSLVDLDYFGPFVADFFEGNINFDNVVFSLWVESDGTLQQVANTNLDTWNYGSLQDVAAAYSDGELVVSWSPIEAAHQYMIEVYEAADSGGSEGGPMPGSEQAAPILVRSGFTGNQGVMDLPSDIRAQDVGRIVLYAINSRGAFALSIVDETSGLPPITFDTQYINYDTASSDLENLLEGGIRDRANISGYDFELSISDTQTSPATLWFFDSGTVCDTECRLVPGFSTWSYTPPHVDLVDLNIPLSDPADTVAQVYPDAIELKLSALETEHVVFADMVVMTNDLRLAFEDLMSVRTIDGIYHFSGRAVPVLDGLDVTPEEELNRVDEFEYRYLSNMESWERRDIDFSLDGATLNFEFSLDESEIYPFGAPSINLDVRDVAKNEVNSSFSTVTLEDLEPELIYNQDLDSVTFDFGGSVRAAFSVEALVPGFALSSGEDFTLGNQFEVGSSWGFTTTIESSDDPPVELTQEGELPLHIVARSDGGDVVSRFEATMSIVVE